MLQITAHTNADKREALDALVIPFWSKDKQAIFASSVEISEQLKQQIRPPIAARDFQAKEGQIVWLWASNEPEARIGLLGLGDQEECTPEKLRKIFYTLMRECMQKKYERFTLFLPHILRLDSRHVTQAIIEGLWFASYAFSTLKHDTLQEVQEASPKEVMLLTREQHATQEIASSVAHVMKATFFARDLVN